VVGSNAEASDEIGTLIYDIEIEFRGRNPAIAGSSSIEALFDVISQSNVY